MSNSVNDYGGENHMVHDDTIDFSSQSIDESPEHDISDDFVSREHAEAACKLVGDSRQDRVKNRVTIDDHPHNTSPPLLT